jgi:hypothetical protein
MPHGRSLSFAGDIEGSDSGSEVDVAPRRSLMKVESMAKRTTSAMMHRNLLGHRDIRSTSIHET